MNAFLRSAAVTATRRTVVSRIQHAKSTKATAASALARRWKSSPPVSATTAAQTASVAKPTSSASSSTSSSVPIGQSLLAALLGITTVSIAAASVEQSTSNSCPEYSSTGQRFDQSTFTGRFARMLLACDPRLLLYTETQIRQAQDVLTKYATGELKDIDNRTLWESRRIVDAAVHPDTGDLLPRPFRMSGYVPYNGPICVAMVASTSTPSLLFWSWVNQSQNALVNYYNRNASSPMTNETLIKSYSAAVGSALAVAFGLATFIQRRYSPQQAKALMKWVAFPSAMVASSLNCYIVRSPEIKTGVPLLDEDLNIVGNSADSTSYEAAKRGVNTTTISRAILQAPVYFVPPLLLGAIKPIQKIITKNPRLSVPITTYLLLVSFGIGLPSAIAIFPQIASISASDVEPEYQHLINPKTSRPYETFYYNKGL